MKFLSHVMITLLALSGCVQNDISVKRAINPTSGKSVIVEISGLNDWHSTDFNCSQQQLSQQKLELQQRIQSLLYSQEELSNKLAAHFRLRDNLVAAIDTAKNCDELNRSIAKFESLNSINELNSDFNIELNVAYHKAEKVEVAKVWADYGPLRLKPETAKYKFNASYSAWSGYWYPISNIDVLINENSALAKFDAVLQRNRRETGVLDFERSLYGEFNNQQAWEGHCHAWSVASVVFPEPQGPVTVNGQTFSVDDIRALYTKAAEDTPYAQYGISYRGDFSTDGTYQDIRPEAFHRALQSQLIFGQPVVLDRDPGPQVWTRPVTDMYVNIEKDPLVPNAVLVKTSVGMVVQKDYITNELTTEDDHTFLHYNYRLYLAETPDAEGAFEVIAGEWLGESLRNHPDVIIVPMVEQFKSKNPILNKNLDLLEKLKQ